MSSLLAKHKVVYALRKTAEKYKGSKRPSDVTQAQTLENMADDIVGNDMEQALVRFDSVHPNIKANLPFFVLDYLDQAEKHFDL